MKVAQRRAPRATDAELEHGIPLFLDQLTRTLRVEQSAEPMRSRMVSGAAGAGGGSEMGQSAALHGRELLTHGFTVDQVVHDYGDLCQGIMDLAFERDAPIEVDEFRTLNRCLDNAIADAVAEFSYQREALVADKAAQVMNERLGFLAHELRNLINTATLARAAIKQGNVGVAGATGAALDRSLIGLRNLIDRSLADVRIKAGMPAHHQLMRVADLIAEIQISASLEAQARECGFAVSPIDPSLAVVADHDLFSSAVGNLLQNAFKYTQPHTDVTLKAYCAADRVLIEVADHCGGLHPGDAERMFAPFTQVGQDRSGLGLGLSICRSSVDAINGMLHVRDVPGTGCIFTIDLPRRAVGEAVQ